MTESDLPPLDLVGPDGERIRISGLRRKHTVADLADLMGTRVSIDEEIWPAGQTLATIGQLRIGTRLDALSACDRSPTNDDPSERTVDAHVVDADSSIDLAVVGGPDCSRWERLAPGRHVVGRAPHLQLRLGDPLVEPHHAVIDAEEGGAVRIVQLSGVAPIRIEGRPVVSAIVEPGDRVDIGTNTLQTRRPAHPTGGTEAPSRYDGPSGVISRHPSDPWRRLVQRGPHLSPRSDTEPEGIAVPVEPGDHPTPRATGLIGAGAALVGGTVVATVMGNPMFMLFAAVGAAASIGTWSVAALAARRQRRRARRRHAAEIERFADALTVHRARAAVDHAVQHPTVSATLTTCEALRSRDATSAVWSRRRSRPMKATIGVGDVRRPVPIGEVERSSMSRSVLRLSPELTAAVAAAEVIPRSPAPMTVRPGDLVAFEGPWRTVQSVARSVIVQWATWVGPADWRLLVVSKDRAAWSWCDWLPHRAGVLHARHTSADVGSVVDEMNAGPDRPRLLVVTDDADVLTEASSRVRRLLEQPETAALLVIDAEQTVPAVATRVLSIGSTGLARWSGDVPADDDATDIHVAGISVETARRAALALACLVDPEEHTDDAARVPEVVDLADLLDRSRLPTPDEIVETWRAAGPDPSPVAPIGVAADGVVELDMVRDGPHGLIAGTTGSGKSELLRSLVVGMAARVPPEHLNFVLVDYKGGSTFDACSELPHTVGVVTDLDDGLAERALISLDAELRQRERLLRAANAPDLTAYRTMRRSTAIARLMVIVDEFAALAAELPEFLASLVGVAQRGRSLGVHLVLATQRPSGIISDEIRANTNVRIALRLNDRRDAVDVVGAPAPSGFRRTEPGRAALRLGPDDVMILQTARTSENTVTPHDPAPRVERLDGGRSHPHCAARRSAAGLARHVSAWTQGHGASGSADGSSTGAATTVHSDLERLVAAIGDAASLVGSAAPWRPWVEPLDHPLAHADVTAALRGPSSRLDESDRADPPAIGLVDVPGEQSVRPLCWNPGDGNLALIGSLGSGLTSTLIALASSICRWRPPASLHLYVVDAVGDDSLAAMASLAHCGGVVRVGEVERLHRLLTRVVTTIDHRKLDRDVTDRPLVVVMIDGIGPLRAALSTIERAATAELLIRLLDEGPAVGVTTVFTDRGAPHGVLSTATDRWVFRTDDRETARAAGVPPSAASVDLAGRLRIASSGLVAQVAAGAAGLAEIPSRTDGLDGPPELRCLPERVVMSCGRNGDLELGAIERDGVRLMLGLAAEELEPAGLLLRFGDPLLVIGAPRTGVSTAVSACVEAWCAATDCESDGPGVLRVDRHRPLDPAGIPPDRAVAVVVDDAHRVDDRDGTLLAIGRGEHPNATLIVGARADAVRSAYGHWTRELAALRSGIVMASTTGTDGDVLGASIPRRPVVAARPGLAWIVDDGPLRQIQIAVPVALDAERAAHLDVD